MTARTLREDTWLTRPKRRACPRELSILIEAISDSCRTISSLVSRVTPGGRSWLAGTGNVQGQRNRRS